MQKQSIGKQIVIGIFAMFILPPLVLVPLVSVLEAVTPSSSTIEHFNRQGPVTNEYDQGNW